jgi:hypothetical protein
MAGYIGWHDLNFGARNAYDGESDVARNLLVWIGVPVAFVYRGAFHRIAPGNVKDPQHLARLRQFFCDYYGWTSQLARAQREAVDIPIKRRPGLGLMAGMQILVWLSGVGVGAAFFGVFVALGGGRPLGRQGLDMVVAAGAAVIAFCGLLATYVHLRRPSRRQAAIRAAVLRRVGTYADLADWKIASLGPLFPLLGIVSLDPAYVLAEADDYRAAGKFDDALVRARITVAFAQSREEAFLIERAQLLTDDCLARLEGSSP